MLIIYRRWSTIKPWVYHSNHLLAPVWILKLIFWKYSNEVKKSNSGITTESTDRYLPLKFQQNWVSNSWDIADLKVPTWAGSKTEKALPELAQEWQDMTGQDRSEQVGTGQDRSGQVSTGWDSSGNVLPELTQENKNVLAEPTRETKIKIPELAQET